MTTAGSAVASSASTAAPAGDAKKLRGGERAWPARTRHAGAARCARQALSCVHLSVYMCIYIFPGASKNTYLYNPYRRQAAARSAQVGKRRGGPARTCARGRPCGRAPCSLSAEGGAAHTKAVRTAPGFHASVDASWPFECAAAGCRCVAGRTRRCMACAMVSCAATQTHARARAHTRARIRACVRTLTHVYTHVGCAHTHARASRICGALPPSRTRERPRSGPRSTTPPGVLAWSRGARTSRASASASASLALDRPCKERLIAMRRR